MSRQLRAPASDIEPPCSLLLRRAVFFCAVPGKTAVCTFTVEETPRVLAGPARELTRRGDESREDA